MHTNYRRKVVRNKPIWTVLPLGIAKEMQRFSWKSRRQKVRAYLHHGKYDLITDRYFKDVLWNYF